MNQLKRKTAVLTAIAGSVAIAAMSTSHAVAAIAAKDGIDISGGKPAKPAAKIGKGKTGSKNEQNSFKDLIGKAQATAKEAIAEASGLAKAGKPVADLTHREAGLGNYKHFNVKSARLQGARAVGAHAA